MSVLSSVLRTRSIREMESFYEDFGSQSHKQIDITKNQTRDEYIRWQKCGIAEIVNQSQQNSFVNQADDLELCFWKKKRQKIQKKIIFLV